jgi:hypothetical protein
MCFQNKLAAIYQGTIEIENDEFWLIGHFVFGPSVHRTNFHWELRSGQWRTT